MGMNIFEGLQEDNLADTLIDPKRLFRALSKPANSPYKFPHDIQTEVWNKWFPRRTEADLVIKMNTGSGKTVIGLTILKSSLNEGVGPAAFFVPDTQLEQQARETAQALGIPWTSNPRDPEYLRGDSVLITTIHTLYNGLSKFGLKGTGTRPLPLGTAIIDDAHACIVSIEQQFSLKIPRKIKEDNASKETTEYRALLDLFSDSLEAQSFAGYRGLRDNNGTVPVALPYWDWQARYKDAFKIINSSALAEKMFKWPLINNQLPLCDVAFTPSSLEIKLPLPDLSMVPSFTQATRRIYMTATLADDSVLTTHMNVQSDCVTKPIAPDSASDIGDRIILSPLETSRSITKETVIESLHVWAEEENVVVIVPSEKTAKKWRNETDEVHDKNSIVNVISRLKNGHVGLVVLIARYDGIDLPYDACRILVLDGLPEMNSPCERAELEALMTAEAIDARQIQRIEQGMGRGVRANDDYCAVILLDPRLVERLYRASSRNNLSPATRAQYELSERFSRNLRGKSIDYFNEAVNQFLGRSDTWVQASKKQLENVTYETTLTVPLLATAERQAFENALAGEFTSARSTLNQVINKTDDVILRGWIKQRAATYLNNSSPVDARQLQRSARNDNKRILKIENSDPIHRLSSLGNQARAAADYLKRFSDAKEFELWIESTLLDLVPNSEPGTYTRFEAAFEKVGGLLGFASSRPDVESRLGPDNLWGIGNDDYWVVEAKSESTAEYVSREYLEQLTHSADWFESNYQDPRYSYTPILIHPSSIHAWDAVPRLNARILTFEKLRALRESIQKYSTSLISSSSLSDEEKIRANLEHYGLASGQLKQRWTVKFSKQRQ